MPQTIEAIVICDCLMGKKRFVQCLNDAAQKIPEFHWRFAQPEEQRQLLNQMQTPMTPLIYLGSKIIIGIPKLEKLYVLIQNQLSSQNGSYNTQ